MKLTKIEAQFIVNWVCTQPPVDDALDRVLSHDWTFDPRGSKLTALLRSYHEQDQVLYGTWSDFIHAQTYPYPDSPHKLMCVLCASTIASAPYFTAVNFTGHRWDICCACASAMGVHVSGSSSVLPFFPSLNPLLAAVPRAFAALRKTLRRLFG